MDVKKMYNGSREISQFIQSTFLTPIKLVNCWAFQGSVQPGCQSIIVKCMLINSISWLTGESGLSQRYYCQIYNNIDIKEDRYLDRGKCYIPLFIYEYIAIKIIVYFARQQTSYKILKYIHISNKAIVKPYTDLLLNTVFHDQRQYSAGVKT